ncbi:hypothetical protein CAEBREN_06500 [Caenorhabditis brenneri]|uniref:G protein-coupled receptor n=1 Tax=Caenorhabditis brenneri TaxID=135651 RepID=G0MUD9_CAEBE|nr:hypothetical protein CAEBREN_06500 [Caenorhabditis brenneri]
MTSIIVNTLGFYIVITSKEQKKYKFVPLINHFFAFLSQFYLGTVLNTVILLPVPGIYCIGWLKNATGPMLVVYIAIFHKLFLFQGEILALVLLFELVSVARKESFFKFSPIKISVIIIVFLGLTSSFGLIVFILSYIPRDELTYHVMKNYPHHTFVLRYDFLWMLSSNKLYIGFAMSFFCAIGIIVVSVGMVYISTYFELEKQMETMSKVVRREHQSFIDEVMDHAKLMFSFFCILPFSIFVQFFVDEETDVSGR